uniref:Uncharacterized protein n=1 Tax=Oncorhynchus tshawytscha TaxID=74940 RepID=A0A8C8H7R9_ONCTS
MGVSQVAGCHSRLGHVFHLTEEQDGQTQQEPHDPYSQADALGPGRPPQSALAHGPDKSQVAVDTYQHQEENTTVVVHGDGHVDQLAHWLAERPVVAVSNGSDIENQAVGQHAHHTEQNQVGWMVGGEPVPGCSVVVQ